MIAASAAKGAFSKLHGVASSFTKGMEPGTISGLARGAADIAGKDPGLAYGAGIGAVGGVLSGDRDQHWYVGAAQGAFAGAQISSRGLSGMGVAGAIGGALYGMVSDDTSIMTGAFVGAGLGAANRYRGAALKHMRQGDLGKKFSSSNFLGQFGAGGKPLHGDSVGQIYNTPYRSPRNRRLRVPSTAGPVSKAGWGVNAVYHAIRRDLGMGWRSGAKTRNVRSNRGSGAGRARPTRPTGPGRSGGRGLSGRATHGGYPG